MVRNVLGTVYNRVFRHIIVLGEDAFKTEFCLKTQNSSLCQIGHPLVVLLYITLGVDYGSVCLSEGPENFIILVKHWESDERSFEENMWASGVCKSKKRGLLISFCLRLFAFGHPCT